MSEEVRAGINGFLGRRVVKKVRVRHTPNLVLGTDPRKMGTWTSEAGASKLAQLKPALELANLDPEVARVVEEAHARYFSEGKGPLPRPD
jgi:hypothetical protein